MIDPRTPILVGAGQITDTVGTAVERALARRLLRRGGERSRSTTRRAAIGGHALGHVVDAIAVMEFFSDISPRFASPYGRSSNPPQSVANRLHADPRQLLYTPLGRQHAPVPGQPFAEEIANGETELALICGAELLRSTQNARRPA